MVGNMIHKKEFYFVRHGQTDHNLTGNLTDSSDIPLNEHGIKQAIAIEQLISSLPIKTVCHSPLKRAKETKNIVTSKLRVPEYEIADLAECSGTIWKEMTHGGKKAYLNAHDSVKIFMDQVKNGINTALLYDGPVLIVAHGGVHWALSCLIEAEHAWSIDNCVPMHFYLEDGELWKVRKLI